MCLNASSKLIQLSMPKHANINEPPIFRLWRVLSLTLREGNVTVEMVTNIEILFLHKSNMAHRQSTVRRPHQKAIRNSRLRWSPAMSNTIHYKLFYNSFLVHITGHQSQSRPEQRQWLPKQPVVYIFWRIHSFFTWLCRDWIYNQKSWSCLFKGLI